MMRTIGAISDAHGLLRPQALAALAGCDPIIHAGDIGICSSSRPRVLIRHRLLAEFFPPIESARQESIGVRGSDRWGVSFSLLGIPTASAETWTFPDGLAGADTPTHSFGSTPGNVMITAAGFSSPTALASGTPNVNLFGKSGGETRMGLAW
jgi:hypothetical protein